MAILLVPLAILACDVCFAAVDRFGHSTFVSCHPNAAALHVWELAPCLHMAFSVTHITTFALSVSSCQLGLSSKFSAFLSCLELFLGFPTLYASLLMPIGACFLELIVTLPSLLQLTNIDSALRCINFG
jgi:hypothetical protein